MDSLNIPSVKRKELLVEFFGAFVPGFVFTVVAMSIIGWAAFIIISQTTPPELGENRTHTLPSSIPSQDTSARQLSTQAVDITVLADQLPLLVKLLVPVFVLAVSYITGSIAMRRRISDVDRASWWQQNDRRLAASCSTYDDVVDLLKTLTTPKARFEDWIRWFSVSPRLRMVDIITQNAPSVDKATLDQKDCERAAHFFGLNQSAARTPYECEFPYHNLRGHLESQGLAELARMVTWDADTQSNLHRCTPVYFETLRLRIKTYCPDAGNELMRLEAAIRLLSTSWFLTRWLKRIGVLAMGIMYGILVANAAARMPVAIELHQHSPITFILWFCIIVGIVAAFMACELRTRRRKECDYRHYYNILALKEHRVIILQGFLAVFLIVLVSALFISTIRWIFTGNPSGLFTSVQHLCATAVPFANWFFLTFIVILIARLAQVTIDKDFHRVRTREVVATFHTAWLTFRHQPLILADLIPNWNPSCQVRFVSPIDYGLDDKSA